MPAGRNPAARGARGVQPPVSSPATFDGPAEDRGRSRSASRARSASQPRTRGLSVEPGLDPVTGRAYVLNRNVDFGGAAYALRLGGASARVKARGPFGKAGRPCKISINSYMVEQWPNKDVHQYDVLVGSGAEKRALVKVIWNTNAVKQAVGASFIFDGNRIGWSLSKNTAPLRIRVDLDKELNRQPRKRNGQVVEDSHRVEIKYAGTVRLDSLRAYINSQISFDESVLESINFLDHLLREDPAKRLTTLRRSYFEPAPQPEGHQIQSIGGGVEAIKGVYQSLRMAEGKKLIINADVSNAVFWNRTGLDALCFAIIGSRTEGQFTSATKWFPNQPSAPKTWDFFKRLKKNHFYVQHRGRTATNAVEKRIDKIIEQDADTYKFDWKDPSTGETKNISVNQYFKMRYNVHLNRPWLPLIEVKRGEVYPMELCVMGRGQRYVYKLNESQTSNMIKFAATRPNGRKAGIETGLNHLAWDQDPFLKHYGMKINRRMIETNARILEPPEVQFAKGATARPMFSGRWDLRGKVFAKPNPKILQSWGVLVLTGEGVVPSQDKVKLFISNLIKTYRGHGGQVQNTTPYMCPSGNDLGDSCKKVFFGAGDQAKMRPQMIVVVLNGKTAEIYNRVKKNFDARFGVVSQCVQGSNVGKNAAQYCSNVLMKFNLKLGGTTSTIKSRNQHFKETTMIIGADVSHASPGLTQGSIAALAVSQDLTCSRYAAACQTNGYRKELITQRNMIELVQPLIQRWLEEVGKGALPKHVYYFRDGVSEGQYAAVIEHELVNLKKAFQTKTQGQKDKLPKFTLVIAEKRHHVRFFPPQGTPSADKNGNPVPGIIVDRDVTQPFDDDVYLNSHSAIQGTARPTHYTVLVDEMNVPVDQFQAMLYEQCYQYQRATTPVSLFPAVYYAHLAAARAIAHINLTENQKWAQKYLQAQAPGVPLPSMTGNETQPPDLIGLEPTNLIHYSMWYI